MATRGGPTKLFWSIAIVIITTISAGLLMLAILRPAAPPSPAEAMDESLVRFLVGCFRVVRLWTSPVGLKSQAEEAEAVVCRDCLRLLWHEYQSSGRMGREYLESIKIIHEYNQTDADIFICGLDYRRCPNRTRALNQFLTSRQLKDELRR